MRPPPVVTGISPAEGPPGTKVIIRGEHLGINAKDVTGMKQNTIKFTRKSNSKTQISCNCRNTPSRKFRTSLSHVFCSVKLKKIRIINKLKINLTKRRSRSKLKGKK